MRELTSVIRTMLSILKNDSALFSRLIACQSRSWNLDDLFQTSIPPSLSQNGSPISPCWWKQGTAVSIPRNTDIAYQFYKGCSYDKWDGSDQQPWHRPQRSGHKDFIRVADAIGHGYKKVTFKTVDSDVVILVISAVSHFNVHELWVFGASLNPCLYHGNVVRSS